MYIMVLMIKMLLILTSDIRGPQMRLMMKRRTLSSSVPAETEYCYTTMYRCMHGY